MRESEKIEIGVVLVTYNRIDKLKKALEKYDNQTYKPEYILIINNNSNDGTKEFLNQWINKELGYKKYIYNLEENIGGSGGFYIGLEEAKKLSADWIWVADDDAYPEENAFEEINKLSKEIDFVDYSAICGKIINNGKIDLEHRRRIKKGIVGIKEYNVTEEEYGREYFYIDSFSYVGTLINKEILKKVGSTLKDLFIYYDDTEHSYRLKQEKPIICVPAVIINHDSPIQENKVTWKRILWCKK